MNRNPKQSKILADLEHKKPAKHSSPQFDEADSGEDESENGNPQVDSQDADDQQSCSEESDEQQKQVVRSKKNSSLKADPEVIKVPSSIHLPHSQSKHGLKTHNSKKSLTPTKTVQKHKSIHKLDTKKPAASKEEPDKYRLDPAPKQKTAAKAPKNVMTYENPQGFDMGQDIISKLRSEFLDKKDQAPNAALEEELGLEVEEIINEPHMQEESDNDDGLLFSSKKTPPLRSKSR